MSKEITRDIIALAIVIGAITSLFLTVNPAGEALIRTLGGLVVGYYFGIQAIPLSKPVGGMIGKKKK